MKQFKLSKSYVPKYIRGYETLKSVFSWPSSDTHPTETIPEHYDPGWEVLPDPEHEVIGFGPHGFIYDSDTWEVDDRDPDWN